MYVGRHRDLVLQVFAQAVDRARDGDIDKQRVAEEVAALAGQSTIYGDDPMEVAESLADWALILADEQALPDEDAALRIRTSCRRGSCCGAVLHT